MINTPDYDRAATAAMEILSNHDITETPIKPSRFLADYRNLRVVPFTHAASDAGLNRDDLVLMFGANQDAALFCLSMLGVDADYVLFYNMRLPEDIISRAIARELGHIVLGHDGVTRPFDVRYFEAMCFAHHLLTPRPIIQIFRDSNVTLTMNILTQVCGCSDDCVEDMQKIPGSYVPKELNQRMKRLFTPHIHEYIRFYNASLIKDRSPVVDFGTYMDGYED